MLFQKIIDIYDPEPHAAALNMAIDEALLQSATLPVLRVYGWSEPAVSLGYFSEYAKAVEAAEGRAMVRRWTGGGLVEHGSDVTYTLLVPCDSAFSQCSPVESYRLIHECIAGWLEKLGISSRVSASGAEERSAACFASHVRHDLVDELGKIAGAAQRRTRWGLLHQGSIQMPRKTELPSLGRPRGLAEMFSSQIQSAEITPPVVAAAQKIAGEKYATDQWLQKF